MACVALDSTAELSDLWRPAVGGVGQALELREFNSGDIVIGGDSQVTPITAVVCQTCGYTFFMNAIISGAVPSEPNHTEQGKGKS